MRRKKLRFSDEKLMDINSRRGYACNNTGSDL